MKWYLKQEVSVSAAHHRVTAFGCHHTTNDKCSDKTLFSKRAAKCSLMETATLIFPCLACWASGGMAAFPSAVTDVSGHGATRIQDKSAI